MIGTVRAFFQQRGVLEVETPVLSRTAATDPAIDPFQSRWEGPGGPCDLWLQTSPEFAMKRLLAAGSGPIWQLCKVFRQGEVGRRHNPEFTLLEWYRPGYDHHALMGEVEALLRAIPTLSLPTVPFPRITWRAAFVRWTGVDPLLEPVSRLRECARDHAIEVSGLELEDRDGWCDLLLSHLIEPALAGEGALFIHDYPASQAALARLLPGEPPVAARFELYLDGIELANGYHELSDAKEQRARFEAENRERVRQGRAELPIDQRLLEALEHGLPDCAGVALGLDRLLLCATGATALDQVIAFPFSRC